MHPNYSIKKKSAIIIGVLLSHFAFCQKNYEKGFIIKSNGDTIHGFIDYRNWSKNPGKIALKEYGGQKDEDYYTPLDIKEFGVTQDIYESAVVEVETSIYNANEINANPALSIKTDTVFLQALVKGPKSLYVYVDGTGKELFYIKNGSSYELLIYKKYVQEPLKEESTDGNNTANNKSKYIRENKRYTGQLRIYLQDCSSISSGIEKTSYTTKSMMVLFKSYYDKTKQVSNYQIKPEKIATEFGVLAGLTLSSLRFSLATSYVDLVNSNFKNSTAFTAGLFMNVVLPGCQGKWAINNELIYTSFRFDSSVSGDLFTKNYSIGYSYIKLNNMVRFKYPVGKMSVFLDAGISNGIAISETNTMQRYTTENVYDPVPAIAETRKYEQGLIMGIGSGYKKYSFEFRVEKGNGMSVYSYLKTTTTREYFMFVYRF